MPYRYVVLGAGRQGVALAYDLAANCEAESILLTDVDPELAWQGVERLQDLLPETPCKFQHKPCDVADLEQVKAVLAGADVVLSAVPYKYNVELTDLAVAAGASFCDLGGNTDVVREQLRRHQEAVAAGVSIAPDCGLAPGLGNIFAAYGIEQMDHPEEAHVRCGGLPQEPVGPLGYKLVFNFQGLINEYSGFGEFLRNGKPVKVPALTEVEQIEFPDSIGRCEAAVTSGGTSTCAASFEGVLKQYDYKTVRYPGHWAALRAMFQLGLFEESLEIDGQTYAPKPLMRALMESRLAYPEIKDLVVLRTTVTGSQAGRPLTLQFDLYDVHDDKTGFTAMERMTAFPAALVAYMQARKLIKPGARPIEQALPLSDYMEEAHNHDIHIKARQL